MDRQYQRLAECTIIWFDHKPNLIRQWFTIALELFFWNLPILPAFLVRWTALWGSCARSPPKQKTNLWRERVISRPGRHLPGIDSDAGHCRQSWVRPSRWGRWRSPWDRWRPHARWNNLSCLPRPLCGGLEWGAVPGSENGVTHIAAVESESFYLIWGSRRGEKVFHCVESLHRRLGHRQLQDVSRVRWRVRGKFPPKSFSTITAFIWNDKYFVNSSAKHENLSLLSNLFSTGPPFHLIHLSTLASIALQLIL